jgi:uncharacterized membrane protein
MNSLTRKRILIAVGATAAVAGTVYALKSSRRFSGIKLKRSVIINQPPATLYEFWRKLENIPTLSTLLQGVIVLDNNRSRWTVAGPGGMTVQWEAEITKDIPNEMIGWRSSADSNIETAGYVKFEPAGQRGSIVKVALEYGVPAGELGAVLATLIGKRPGAHVDEVLRRFKQVMETGETAIA